VQVLDEILEPSRFVILLGNSSLGLEFKGSLSLSNASDLLFFELFLGEFGFTVGLGSGTLFLVEIAVRSSLELAEFISSILVSGFVLLEGRDDGLGSLVGSEELLATEGLDVRIEFDHHSQVLQRVLLSGSSQGGLFGRVDLALDLAGSNQTVEVRVGNQRAG